MSTENKTSFKFVCTATVEKVSKHESLTANLGDGGFNEGWGFEARGGQNLLEKSKKRLVDQSNDIPNRLRHTRKETKPKKGKIKKLTIKTMEAELERGPAVRGSGQERRGPRQSPNDFSFDKLLTVDVTNISLKPGKEGVKKVFAGTHPFLGGAWNSRL